MNDDLLRLLSTDIWVDGPSLAESLGISVRSVAQRLRDPIKSGRVERSVSEPFTYRLVAGGGGRSP